VNSLFEWLSRVLDAWKFWIVVPAWDVAVRMRLGKRASALSPGFHLRIPFVDEITLVNTRQRVWTTPTVDRDLGSGRVLCQQATFGYRINDPLRCIMTYTMPDASIAALIMSGLASGHSESMIAEDVSTILDGTGLELDYVCVTSKATIRGFRLLNNNWGLISGDGARPMTGIARI